MTIHETIHETIRDSADRRAAAGESDAVAVADLVAALVDDGPLARGQALIDDTTAHRRLRRLAAVLPPAAEVYRDARLLAAVSEAVAVADPALYQTFLSHYVLCVGSVVDLGRAPVAATAGTDDAGVVDGSAELAHAHAKGSFMVTEIGDASSHLGTRTRATYDPSGRRFVLGTPDAHAAKFSSVAATGLPQKAVVLARVIVGERDHGVFSFLVDITGEDGTPCAGVHLSAPIALDAVPLPYGLVRFDRVYVPFDRWLNDGARLTDDGGLHDPLGSPDARLQRTLSCGRGLWATLPSALAGMSVRAAVLAWRYNSRRRSHGRLAPGSPVLVYRPQQHAIIGAFATAFTLRCAAESALAGWERIRARGDGAASTGSMAFAPWAAVDRSLALYKAHTTQTTARLIDQLQHRCGVSGFFALNRLPGYLGFARAFDNAGGDNTLTYVDAGRSLAQEGHGHEGVEIAAQSAALAADPVDARWWPAAVAALEQRLASRLHEQLARRAAEGAQGFDLWNPLLDQTRLLGAVHALRLAADAVAENAQRLWPALDRQAADALAALDGVLQARRIAGHLLANAVIEPTTALRLPEAADDLCDRLEPHLPGLAGLLDTGARLAPSPMEAPDYAAALATVLGSDQ